MAVPDFQTFMRPALALFADGEAKTVADVRSSLANELSLSPEDLAELLPSGTQTLFRNRAGWAVTYLFKAGALERPTRATYRITERGRQLLAQHPEFIGIPQLSEFPELREFMHPSRGSNEEDEKQPVIALSLSPEEAMAAAYDSFVSALASELLDAVMAQSPAFFERLVLDVVGAMGYGSGPGGAAEHLGKSNDEGFDGVIYEDRLELDLIYLQAKRWSGKVGRPDIQTFVGALQGRNATKGVFITTSSFSKEAETYAQTVATRLALIDGNQLAHLMIEHGVGVSDLQKFTLRRIDTDYFDES